MKLVKNEGHSADFGFIGRGIEISGDIIFNDRLNVDGKVAGSLTSESGTLIIGESGHLEARIDVGVCVIHGSLHGDLAAKSRVEIRKGGRVNGDVISPVLIVEEGAIFNGAIKMTQDAGNRTATDYPVEDIDNDGKRKARGA